MRYGLKIGKKKKTQTLQSVWTDPHMAVLATPTAVKVTGTSLGSTIPESRRQWFPVMRTPGHYSGLRKSHGLVPKTMTLTHKGC